MKTLIIAITVLFLLGITLPSSKNIPTTDVVYMEEEGYIDDIPFNTDQVVNDSKTFNIEEEGYIDDMPFNTSKIFKTLLN